MGETSYTPRDTCLVCLREKLACVTDGEREISVQSLPQLLDVHRGWGGRFVRPQRAWFLSHFGLKEGIDFDNFGLK